MFRQYIKTCFLIAGLSSLTIGMVALGQIGGRTAASGPFVIDAWEDLNLTSESLGRNWLISVIVTSQNNISLENSGLTLAPGQTPVGAIQPRFPDDNAIIVGLPNSIFGDFGIPMPGAVGASTDPNAGGVPGDLTSFDTLRFFQCYELMGGRVDTELRFNILLECYPQNPDGSFPTIQWNYIPTEGKTFAPTTVDLRSPTAILDNPSTHSLETLLSQTRFLDFFYFATPVGEPGWIDARVDDITLVGASSSMTLLK